jgi:hypothetical protein
MGAGQPARLVSVTPEELRLRHLEAIQQVVNRLAQNSFTIRGWSVTLASVVFALLSTQGSVGRNLVLVSLAPVWIFWGLDAFYLRKERLFRRLFAAQAEDLRAGRTPGAVALFDMNVDPYLVNVPSLPKTLLAPHVAAVPATLTVIVLAFWIVGLR